MHIFPYGELELNHLKQQDPLLGQAAERIGRIERAISPDIFAALVSSIVSQQISGKAAATVEARLLERVQTITPAAIAAVPIEDIQRCGMSMRKAGYIKSLSGAVTQGDLDVGALADLPDGEVMKRLSALPGIGVWTAEMILIFAMGRPDVVSYGDFGIRRGMMNLYGLENLSKPQFEQYKARYSPYGTVASFYLWEIAREKQPEKQSK